MKRLTLAAVMAGSVSLIWCRVAPAQDVATKMIEFRIDIEPVFFVETDSEGSGNIRLGPVMPGASTPPDTARVTIHTNAGRPYRVLQRLEQGFSSERGLSLRDRVLFSVSDGARGGQSQAPAPRPLSSEPAAIFLSNPQGDADQFNVSYFADSEQLIPAGTYRARIVIDGELR